MSDEGLIDPSAFPIPDTLTYLLDSAAAKLKADGTDLTDTAGDITGAWAGLDGIYSAPESATLFNVLNPLTGDADEVSSALSSASDALIDFAEKARDIKDRWYTLRSDSYAFLQSIDYGRDEDWDEGSGMLWWKEESPKVAEHNALLDRAAALKHEFEEAERTCANAITALFGGTTFIAQRADGSVTPGAGEFVYGFDAPLEGVEMEWGAPQTSDYAWYTDATDAVGDYVVGMAEDLGGMVGAHGPEGWFSGSWGDNLWDYWGGTVEGLGSLVGASRDENGNWGWSLETAGNAWKEAAHSVVPWREWGDRPWYVIGTAALNIGATVGGALLTATGVGAVVGVPLLAWRGSRILDGVNGGRADADLPDGGGVDLQTLMSRVPSFGDGSIQPVDLSRLADLDLDQGEFGRMTDALQRLNDLDGGDGASSVRPGNSDNRTVPVDGADGVGGDNGSAPRANTAPGDEPEAAERRGSSDRDRDDAEGDGADQDAEEPTYPTTELLDSSQDFLDGVDPESVRGLREGMDGQENDWVTSQVPDDVSSVNDTPVQRYESGPSRVEAGNERPEELVLAGRGEHEIAEGADGERVDARHDTTVDNSSGDGTTPRDTPNAEGSGVRHSGNGGEGGGDGPGGRPGPGLPDDGPPARRSPDDHDGRSTDQEQDTDEDPSPAEQDTGDTAPADREPRDPDTEVERPEPTPVAPEGDGDLPRPMPEDPKRGHVLERIDEDRVTRDESGLIDTVDGQNVTDYLRELMDQRDRDTHTLLQETSLSKGDLGRAGAVQSLVLDRRTGNLVEAINGRPDDVIESSDLHPLLKAKLAELYEGGPYQLYQGGEPWKTHPTRMNDDPLRHAEIKAANELLWMRGGAGLDASALRDFQLDNRFTNRKNNNIAPCCPNCTFLIPEVRNPTAGRRTEEAQGMESDVEYDD
ncbi:YwqJ-related putative deaminase [Nocardiopsis dassonvillei]|uniref:YwqJ-related putative deaminase n=1 Tax=Nocardiopsis dassonvillei TaxID=2014 RepID=UPI000B9D66B5|nr:YwqJ-related putative deaminase [Nocardiopsis dassonvillei]ASU60910.1 hypothetical protein CGQ36_26620 [Nocardiopsis dassonvillei]